MLKRSDLTRITQIDQQLRQLHELHNALEDVPVVPIVIGKVEYALPGSTVQMAVTDLRDRLRDDLSALGVEDDVVERAPVVP